MLNLAHSYPGLSAIVDTIKREWPAHSRFTDRRFDGVAGDGMVFAERLAGLIAKINPNDMASLVAGYKWTCAQMMYEEAFFRKEGRYRQENYEQVFKNVYDNKDYMAKYLSGLLLSQLMWTNHFEAMRYYNDFFLNRLDPGSSLIEIGPGHGLLLALAAEHPMVKKVAGVDISSESTARTKHAMDTLGYSNVDMQCLDLDKRPSDFPIFDALVCSEVLEHLEDPVEKLASWITCVRPGGSVYINVPINSPAPDHIFLLRNYRDCIDVVEKAGLTLEGLIQFPATGLTLRDAIDKVSTVTCVVVCRR